MDEVIANAKANVDTCATPDEMRPLMDALRIERKKNAAERHTEKYVGVSEPEADALYYIYNVKAKRFLGAAEAWGTHLATEYVSNEFALIPRNRAGEDLPKGFLIETFRPNGAIGEADFMGYNGFIDCPVDDAWDFVPVEGKQNVFNIVRASWDQPILDEEGQETGETRKTNVREDGSLYYLGLRDGGENGIGLGFNSWNVVDTDMKDPANEGNQWMLITRDEMNELMLTATQENPIDASHLIVNPSYDQRLPIDDWFNGSVGGGTGVWGRGGNYVDFVWENWNTEYAEVTQTLYDLPAGWYQIDVQGYYRDGHYTTHMLKETLGIQPALRASVFAYLGDSAVEDAVDIQKSPICSFSDGINMVPGMGRRFTDNVTWTTFDEETGEEIRYQCQGDGSLYCTDACWSAAEEYFQNGLWWNHLIIKVPEGDGILTIGAMKEGQEAGDWLVVDNWRLKYLGNTDPQEVIDGIEKVNVNVNEGTIYNLSGQRLNKVQKGVNIINGKKVLK